MKIVNKEIGHHTIEEIKNSHLMMYIQQNDEYTYDRNGNLTQDLNKRISSIQYNLLNLPQNITYSTGSTIAYTYDAADKKQIVIYDISNT